MQNLAQESIIKLLFRNSNYHRFITAKGKWYLSIFLSTYHRYSSLHFQKEKLQKPMKTSIN